jgi:hypothetical protein
MNIPDLPIDAIIDPDTGRFSDVGKTFFQQLLTQMQNALSNEGFANPNQTATNITTIQNNQNGKGQYTCAFGTCLYNSTANSIQFAIDDGTGAPIFKTATLT